MRRRAVPSVDMRRRRQHAGRRRRTRRLLAGGAALLVLLGGVVIVQAVHGSGFAGRSTATTPGPVPEQAASCRAASAVSAILVPNCGAWWGVAPGEFTGQPEDVALRGYEQQTGETADIVHSYHRGAELFPTVRELGEIRGPDHNRILYFNWKPELGRTWAQVAAGDPAVDAEIDREAAHLKKVLPTRFFLSVHHEPENEVVEREGSGFTARDYAAMFRYVVQRLRADGVTTMVTVMCFMAYAPWNHMSWWPGLYPGDDVVDWIGYDSYATVASGYFHGDFADIANRRDSRWPSWPGFYTWATTTHPDKPLMLAEWGVVSSSSAPSGKTDFFRSMPRQLAHFDKLKALVYFDSPAARPLGDTRVATTAASAAAYRALMSGSARVPASVTR